MYCVKCRKATETENVENVITKNGRHLVRGRCVVCGRTKTKFVAGTAGGELSLNSVINNLPFEMHLPGHNFTGPGTRLDKRLNPDLTPKSWSMPINRVDNAAYHHDVCYLKNKDTKVRNEICDKDMIEELDGIVDPTLRERFERGIVKPIIKTKARFGMGVSKNKVSFLLKEKKLQNDPM